MIHKASEFIFHEAYVAFHFHRDNPYSPWVAIGVALAYNKFADARYIAPYVHVRQEFKAEASASNGLSGTHHFMDVWHNAHQETNNVVSKVIRYCTAWHNMEGVLQHLGRSYLGILDANKFGMLSIMLKSREFYFPVVFQERNARRPVMVAELKKVGLIK